MSNVPARNLSLFDSTNVIVGIIIGVGIYQVVPDVARCMGSWSGVLGIWLAGGMFAFVGALCYAELATAYPSQGGDYVYLTKAYGRPAGYMFGWAQLAVVRPGDIALMAFAFATYAAKLHGGVDKRVYAVAAIATLTIINAIGVKSGKWTQNVLTVAKVIGLVVIIVAAFTAPVADQAPVPVEGKADHLTPNLALIFVLFTFGGWHEMAYVAAEVKDPKRNIVRALVTGTVAVTALYLLVNAAFLHALGPKGVAGSTAVAYDAIETAVSGGAARAVSALICISALGSANGLIFTGSRITYAMGAEHRAFRGIGRWHPRLGTPVVALVVQGILAMAIAIVAGSFEDTLFYSAVVVWPFFLATGLSVLVLRFRDPDTPRPYKMTGYPIPAILFCACSCFMIYSSATYAWSMAPKALLIAAGVLAVGLISYPITERMGRRR